MKSVTRCDIYWAEPEHTSTKARVYRAFAACFNRRKESFSNSGCGPLEAGGVICSATLNHVGCSSLRAAISFSESPLTHLSPTDFDEGCSPPLFIARNLPLHGLTTYPSPKTVEPINFRAGLGAILMELSVVFGD